MIRSAREDKGLSIEETAPRAGMTAAEWEAMEEGQVPEIREQLDPKYNQPLIALAEKAKTVNGYMVEVKGYASATGSATLNQRLSEDRANSVTSILLQQGHIPLTNMLAPGAMGESSRSRPRIAA